jgi:hypothetical protein
MPKPIRPIINPDLEDEAGTSRKRLFIGLTLATSLLVCLALVTLWVIPYIGLRQIHPAAPWTLGLAIATLIGLVSWASIGLVLSVLGLNIPYFSRMRGLTIKLFLPLMTMLGRLLGFSKQQVRSSFIKVNNELVDRAHLTCPAEKMLLLLPHCLQRSKYAYRLTYNVNNCKRCGLCPIGGLLELSDKYGVSMAIATGGTIARRIVVQKRPRLILAVACERDLSSGIQDTYPIPVYGVLNERPNGPCLDTQVNLNNLEAAIRRFLPGTQLEQIDAAWNARSENASSSPALIKVADES